MFLDRKGTQTFFVFQMPDMKGHSQISLLSLVVIFFESRRKRQEIRFLEVIARVEEHMRLQQSGRRFQWAPAVHRPSSHRPPKNDRSFASSLRPLAMFLSHPESDS